MPAGVAREGAGDPRRPARAPSRPHDLPHPLPGQRGEDRHARGAEGLPAPGRLARGALRGDRDPPAGARPRSTRARSCCRCSSPTCPSSAAGAASPTGGACLSPRSSASPTGSSSTRRSGATSRRPTPASSICSTASPSPTSRSRARCPGGAGSRSSGPGSATIEKLRVEGPRADAELVAGWLRSRLKRDIALTRRDAPAVRAMWVDGEPVASPGELLERERAALGRARSVRPRRGLRGCGQSGRSRGSSDQRAPSSSSAAAVRLARPEPNVVMRPFSAGGALGRVADIDDDAIVVDSKDRGGSSLLPRMAVDVADRRRPAGGRGSPGRPRSAVVELALRDPDRLDVAAQLAEDGREIV